MPLLSAQSVYNSAAQPHLERFVLRNEEQKESEALFDLGQISS